ncbi:serine hydrolase, partial [Candidatus Marinimicrobia bacterium]|nr:serine hydrolase [Candidatus Neomarinimicrobiota bacterium]
ELLQFIESTMETHFIPGLSVSVVKNNNIVWEKQVGYANIVNDILVDENTMFILSSISKTITATALMQLFENGLFNLDDDIDPYLPFNVNHPDFPLMPITFRMLLTHSSGIRDNWSVMTYYDSDPELELNYYLNQYFTAGGQFYNSNLNFTSSMPGTNYTYSNNAVALIGLLVEQISNQPFNEYCNENIFEPLSMNNAYWFLSEIDNINQVASPYQFTGGSGDSCFMIGCGIYEQSNPCYCDSACIDYEDCCPDYVDVCGENGTGSSSGNLTEYENYGYADYPSGQLRTTSNNLAKLMSAYMNDGVYGGVRILNSDTIELIKNIHYPAVNSTQGLIWYYKNDNGRTLFGHNGSDVGSSTEMFISFSDNLGVVLLTNSNNYNAMIQIEHAIFDFAEETDFIAIGDINSDGIINILDVVQVVNLILGNFYQDSADLNDDGIINVLDIVQIVNIILN